MALFLELLTGVSFVYLVVTHSNSSSYLAVILFSLSILCLYVLSISYSPVYSPLGFSSGFLSSDTLAFWLGYLVLFVTIASFLVVPNFTLSLSYAISMLSLACLLVFTSSELVTLYVSYELSLLPIIYMIVQNGVYPERSLSACIIFIYTAFFSFPFMVYVIFSIADLGSTSFSLTLSAYWGFSPYVVSIAFLGFMVKLPVYGLHFWLPIAHVEAPTYGSIILAGLLLKIGGCGLYRVSFFTSFVSFSPYFISYLTFSLVFSSIVCCVQADFKRLVAYSSIAHIIVVTLAVVLSSSLGINSFLLIMVTHGISSPILFILVGITYRLHGTRILAIYRGLLSSIPLLSAFMVFCFTVSVPLPPSLAFLGELQFATVFLSVCFYSILAIFTFVFLGALYNLLWLGSLFGPSNFQISSNLEFSLSTRESLTLGFISLQSLFVLLIL